MNPGEVSVDVQGVGYRVALPLPAWDELKEGEHAMLLTSSYIREDRFDLYGFPDRSGHTLFEALIKLDGIGPRLALELCSLPRGLLLQAVQMEDKSILGSVKGVGKKTAEKLIVELKSLLERHPMILGTQGETTERRAEYDQDAIAALAALGYDSPTILHTLKDLPAELHTTEERVAAALRAL